jgi:16S rRNA (guanine527-N7)-methyltransferase
MMADTAARPDWTRDLPEAALRRLDLHVALLRKWNGAINLVAPGTIEVAWTRHVLDSAQVFSLRGEDCRHWADLGSGAGFPGMVIALLARDMAPDLRVTLVEADRRKAEFLRTVSRETGVPVTVIDERIEAIPALNADVVSARALAPLGVLCGFLENHMAPGGRALLLKGARAAEEVQSARQVWSFQLDTLPSATDPEGSILKLTDLHRV